MAEILVEHVNSKAKKENIDPRWWKMPKGDKFSSLVPLVKVIEGRQNFRRISNLKYARLYSNLEMIGLQSGMFSRTATDSFVNNRVTLNVVKSCSDTATAKIAQNKIRISYITDGGDFAMQRRAKLRSKFINAQFGRMGLYDAMPRAFLDGCVFGTGAVKIYREGDEVKCERVLIDELIVDDADGIYGTPSQIHQVRFVSRDVLAEMFPDYKAEIEECGSGVTGDVQSQSSTHLIRIIESWRLPSVKGGKDGRHVMAIENCDLIDEPWTKEYFPFVFTRWNYKLTGFYGFGLAEELFGIQLEINKLLRTTQQAMHLMCVPRVWVDEASMINTQHLSNEVGAIGKYTGNPPIFSTAPAMSSEVYQHIENLYRKAFEITGISMLSAASKKPAGLDSAVALREFQDIESERFKLVGSRYEEAYKLAAKMVSDLNVEIEKDTGIKIKVEAGKYATTISWKECVMDDKDYILSVFPVSILPSTPAGKLARVQELAQAGFVSKEQAMSLLDFPDLESVISLENAAIDDCRRMIDLIVDSGEYQSPEPYMNLTMCVKVFQTSYLKYRTQKVPEDRLELLRTFMDECFQLMKAPDQKQQQLGFAPPTPETQAPQAVPQAQPQSDLMNQVPQGM